MVIVFLIVRGEYALVPNPPTRTAAQLVIAELLHGFSDSPLPVHVAVGARREIDLDFLSAPFSNSLPHDVPGLWGGGVRNVVIGDEPIGRVRVHKRCVVHPTIPIFSSSGMCDIVKRTWPFGTRDSAIPNPTISCRRAATMVTVGDGSGRKRRLRSKVVTGVGGYYLTLYPSFECAQECSGELQ